MAPTKEPFKTPKSRASFKKPSATPDSRQGSKTQKSILGFFQKSSPIAPAAAPSPVPNPTPRTAAASSQDVPSSSPVKRVSSKKLMARTERLTLENVTPLPSSDPVEFEAEEEEEAKVEQKETAQQPASQGTPSRRAKKRVNYAESEDDDEDDIVPSNARVGKRRKTTVVQDDDDDDEEFKADDFGEYSDLDLDDFIAPDESDEEVKPARKRKPSGQSRKPSPQKAVVSVEDEDLDIDMLEVPEGAPSTAQKWKFDPKAPPPDVPYTPQPRESKPGQKQKAHMSEPEQRYPWLAKIMDIEKHPVGHPDYDPRTLYIPPMAWAKFSPFEKQYWEIKQKFWDTVVFFKKGKFYELYENDATVGHQLFDLKLTDRVNMRMVGVPEMSLDYWASQFVAKGFKVARVDQKETALGKEMREKDGSLKKKGKEEKVIRRELESVLTSGTLVEGTMLQDDMATYCVAIKESISYENELPIFGIAFVDTSTGQFFLSEFVDDPELTKFETFVAQTRPQELLIEKGNLSTKALRILKNNTSLTTIWNTLKPGKEFWEADITRRELEVGDYFKDGQWPEALATAKDKDVAMSSFGALLQYLRMLKLERGLITIGNFTWYDPIRALSSLVLDGQTLINLEIFANSHDGTADGTLFQLLNRCVTPFGKRAFKQWVCHPLIDSDKINERLDAVDALNANTGFRDQYCSELSKLPDLERLISRVHAGTCKPQDFVKVLEGFEQIDYTIGLLKNIGGSTDGGVVGKLIQSMPDLSDILSQWETKFDRNQARDNGFIIPCGPGEFEDYDESKEKIDKVEAALDEYLRKMREQLGSQAICYRDNGKEVYQLEVPAKIKTVPKSFSQMSATKQVKRYYSPELRAMIRELQEAQETHSQIVRDLRRRIYQEFDKEYSRWLAAVRVVAQLDCLVSLAKASVALGFPNCRPQFVDNERSVVEFEELRHPCMLPNAGDFIPNDIILGGDTANINLLTGANAAGKSTVLRMTCTAVIMAQIGCYVPCQSARLTPCDRIMSRLGANDNIFAAQSTFFVELSETKKILSEATPRSLVILDELGRGTSSYDGLAVAQAVLHHVATHIGCVGFFATHYHSLAAEFDGHPEIAPRRMRIHVDEAERRVTFLYKLEPGVAEGSFGMHCASMCGIPSEVVEEAEVAAKQWEHTSRLRDSLEKKKGGGLVPLGWWSDVSWAFKEDGLEGDDGDERNVLTERGMNALLKAIESM